MRGTNFRKRFRFDGLSANFCAYQQTKTDHVFTGRQMSRMSVSNCPLRVKSRDKAAGFHTSDAPQPDGVTA